MSFSKIDCLKPSQIYEKRRKLFLIIASLYHLQKAVSAVIKQKLIVSAHDVSEGGLFVTLTESGFNNNLGYTVTSNINVRKDAFLFGEAQSRVVVSVTAENELAFKSVIHLLQVPFEKLGTVTEENILVDGDNWGSIVDWKTMYDNAIGDLLAKEI